MEDAAGQPLRLDDPYPGQAGELRTVVPGAGRQDDRHRVAVHLDQLIHEPAGEGVVAADDVVRFGVGYRLGLGQDPAPRGGDQPRAAIAQAAEALGHGQIVSAGYQALISADKERFALVARWVVVWPPLRVPAFVPDRME